MSRSGGYIAAELVLVLLGLTVLCGACSNATHEPEAAGPDVLGRDSQRLLPDEVAGVYLGMNPGRLLLARPRAKLNTQAQEPVYVVYDEAISPTVGVLYMFRSGTLKLEKVQVATRLSGVEAIAPRVAAHAQRYGDASGIWDCPGDGGHVPTRRFSWTRGSAGAMDVYLLVGEQVSATLFVAPTGVIREAVMSARCVPTPPERLSRFPVPPPVKPPRGSLP
jgi:hypothetical protein